MHLDSATPQDRTARFAGWVAAVDEENFLIGKSRMVGQVRKLDKAISVLRKLDGGGPSGARKSVGKRRSMSAASRRKIATAQKARWAKWRAAQKRAA
jgi:hypothetical protein